MDSNSNEWTGIVSSQPLELPPIRQQPARRLMVSLWHVTRRVVMWIIEPIAARDSEMIRAFAWSKGWWRY